MRSFLVFTSLLPLLSSANPLPLEPRQSTLDPFSLIASRSDSPIHLSAINANGESFWIGKKTASYCPADVVPHCPAGKYTEFLAGNGGASMASLHPPLYASQPRSNHCCVVHRSPRGPSRLRPPHRGALLHPRPRRRPTRGKQRHHDRLLLHARHRRRTRRVQLHWLRFHGLPGLSGQERDEAVADIR